MAAPKLFGTLVMLTAQRLPRGNDLFLTVLDSYSYQSARMSHVSRLPLNTLDGASARSRRCRTCAPPPRSLHSDAQRREPADPRPRGNSSASRCSSGGAGASCSIRPGRRCCAACRAGAGSCSTTSGVQAAGRRRGDRRGGSVRVTVRAVVREPLAAAADRALARAASVARRCEIDASVPRRSTCNARAFTRPCGRAGAVASASNRSAIVPNSHLSAVVGSPTAARRGWLGA